MADQLTTEQISEVQEIFSLFDKDGDGSVDTRDLAPLLRATGFNPSEAEVQKIIEEVDTDGSSHVDFTGFLSVYTKCDKTGDSEEDFDEAFRVFDKEGNGQISAAEMRHILTNLGEKMTEQQTDAFITFAEPDAQGEIDYKKLLKRIMYPDQA